MANKYLSRKFTLRELILLAVLLVILLIGLYFWLVFYPIQDRQTQLEEDRAELALQIQVAEQREANYDRMSKELEDILKLPENERTFMPKYQNDEALYAQFDVIFAGITNRTITNTGNTLLEDDGIYSRTFTFNFRCDSFDQAKEILIALTHTPYRSLMNGLTISPSNGSVADDSVTVNTTVIFYELA